MMTIILIALTLISVFLIAFVIVWISAMIGTGGIINPLVFFEKGLSYSQEKDLESLNDPYKCSCGIVSRKHQLIGGIKTVCPHCEKDLEEGSNFWRADNMRYRKISDDRKFPFAPKMKASEYLKMKKEETKTNKIKKELKDLSEYDKELEAYEKIHAKKLQELKNKANEIRADLAKNHNK